MDCVCDLDVNLSKEKYLSADFHQVNVNTGVSPYQYAKDAGFEGSENKFKSAFVEMANSQWFATSTGGGGDTIYFPEQKVSGGMVKNLQMALQAGFEYDVYVNGVLYACTAHADGSTIYLGNPSINNSGTSLPHNNEPFYILWYGGSATSAFFYKNSTLTSPITVKVTDHSTLKYNKLPKEFLPEGIGGKLTVTDDGNGKLTIKGA